MGVNVNTFKTGAEFICNKVQSGESVTPTQFNLMANQAQLQVFERDRMIFLKTGDSSDYLDYFLKTKYVSIDPVTGYADYPTDFQHTAGVRYYFNGKERPVDLVTNQAWGQTQASELFPPTKTFPKYTEFKDEYRFLPRDIGMVMLDYWKTPTPPIWGYTIVNNEPVYDASTSTNFEWPEFAMNEVMACYLSLIGVNLKDMELSQFSQLWQNQTKSVL